MIPPEFVQQLLSRVDIVDVLSPLVELKKTGSNLSGLCPFHGEKTPSFSVSPSKQFYHCFGCGAHGDALRFLMEYQGLGFVEAVQDLARRVGMEVPQDSRSVAERQQAEQLKVRRKGLAELLEQAAQFYAKELRKHPEAIEYLKGRGLSGAVAAEFGIGYAAPGWRALARCFPSYDDAALVEAGLVITAEPTQGETAAKRYDRFRERIMFPIRNVAGECIGFGGRVMGQGEPKYLNSPETPVFSKGTELYGLHEARAAIRQRGHALVVEGYMDVVALAQHGIRNGVATLGTACTAEHVQKLFRFTERVVFSFDGDAAGRRAATRALQACLPHLSERRSAGFLFLPAEHDPDSFVRAEGSEAFDALVDRAKPLSAFLIDCAAEDCSLDTPEGRARFVAQARALWTPLPDGLLKRQLLGEIARQARLADEELQALWQQGGTPRIATDAPASRSRAERLPPARRRGGAGGLVSRLPSPEERVLGLLLLHSAWWEQLTPDEHEALLQRASAPARLLAWLDRLVAEQGPLAWATLRASLLADDVASQDLALCGCVDLAWLDERAAEQAEWADLRAALDTLRRGGVFVLPRLPRPS
ncbi:MAG: DNA primase [Inhella sp.]|nr:DNA primase [Inhella sp.]